MSWISGWTQTVPVVTEPAIAGQAGAQHPLPFPAPRAAYENRLLKTYEKETTWLIS
jgi:hypothetical protein